jgi:hypothetical protein
VSLQLARLSGIPERPWQPLLDGAIRQQAMQAVDGVAAALRDATTASDNGRARELRLAPSLAGGAAGLAVLHAYLARAGIESDGFETAERFLEQAETAVETEALPPGLYSGFTGVAWAGTHVDGPPDSADDDPYEAVDGAVTEYLDHHPMLRGYDLVNGLVGLGVYAIERLPLPSAEGVLTRVVEQLETTLERHQSGITWATPPALLEMFPGRYNLGVAHGVPGVVGLLAASCHAGVARAQSESLLRGATVWLLAQRLPSGDGVFPFTCDDNSSPKPSRSAWCYGDPGIAAVLWNAGAALNDESLTQEALSVARHAARRSPDRCGVVDAGLCHGAAGLGHIFNRLYQASGDAELADAARFWLGRCLELREPHQGYGGFRSLTGGEAGALEWVDDPGVLTGAAGVALALLAAVSPVEPEWDRMLLLSMRQT